MKLTRGRRAQISKLVICMLLGWCTRVIFHQITNTAQLTNRQDAVDSLMEGDANCPTCQPAYRCPQCLPSTVQAQLPTGVPPAYKPKGMYEVIRWIYFDEQNVYDIINEKPRLDTIGYWREETKAASQVALDYINSNRMLGISWNLVKLHSGYLKTDAQRGTDYMLDLVVTPANINHTGQAAETMFRVRLVHPYEALENARQLSVKRELHEEMKVIIPLSFHSSTVESLIDYCAKEIKDKATELVFVIFTGVTAKERQSSTSLLTTIREKTKKYPNLRIKSLVKEGQYHYSKGVQHGCLNAAQANDIVVAIQEDVLFTSSFLSHCRAIAEPAKRAYFPVPFKQYEPEIIERGMPPGKPKNVDKKDHNKYTGFWAHTFYEYFCAYQVDVVSALSGPYRTQKNVNIYELFLRKQVEPFSAVEPGLFKTYSQEHCERNNVREALFQKCFNRRAESMGSKATLGILYITEVIHKKKKT